MGNKERRGGVKGGDATTLKGDPSRLGSHTAIIEQLILHADQVCQKNHVSHAVLRIRDVYPGSEFFLSRVHGGKDFGSRIRLKEFKRL
jgi:hypothetical protein